MLFATRLTPIFFSASRRIENARPLPAVYRPCCSFHHLVLPPLLPTLADVVLQAMAGQCALQTFLPTAEKVVPPAVPREGQLRGTLRRAATTHD